MGHLVLGQSIDSSSFLMRETMPRRLALGVGTSRVTTEMVEGVAIKTGPFLGLISSGGGGISLLAKLLHLGVGIKGFLHSFLQMSLKGLNWSGGKVCLERNQGELFLQHW